MTEIKRKVRFFESSNMETLANDYMEWVNNKDEKVSNMNEQFSVEGMVYHLAVFFDKETE